MRRLLPLLILVMMFNGNCNKPSLKTILLWGKQGLDQVCAVGQDTLPNEVCQEGDTVIDLAIGIADHDNTATRTAILKLLNDVITKFPELGDYFGWLVPPQSQQLVAFLL